MVMRVKEATRKTENRWIKLKLPHTSKKIAAKVKMSDQ